MNLTTATATTRALKLAELAASRPTPSNRGRAMFLAEQVKSTAVTAVTQARLEFLNGYLNQPADVTPTYEHPENGPAQQVDHTKTSLTAADIAWLDRLPRDPAQVTLSDARTLRALMATLPLGTASASDRRLVEASWLPVKAFHDHRRAELELDLAQTYKQAPSLLDGSADAVAEALIADNPGVHKAAAFSDARTMLSEALGRRTAEGAQTANWAQRRLDGLIEGAD